MAKTLAEKLSEAKKAAKPKKTKKVKGDQAFQKGFKR